MKIMVGKIGGEGKTEKKSPKNLGKRFEREAARLFERFGGRRIPGSGSFGGTMGDASLLGDVEFSPPWWKTALKGDAKHGYGGANYLTVKREWFKKIREEAKQDGDKIPFLVFKFKGVTSNDVEERASASFIAFNLDTFDYMLGQLEDWWEVFIMLLDKYYKEREEL
jgi:hypothetical protein